jgi:Putative MetA-pathway of phenol degradation
VIALNALIASPAQAGRPLATEDTGTLDPGKVELELGVDYLRETGAEIFLLPSGPAFNIGLLPRLEGTLATQFVLLDPDDEPSHAGFGDSQVKLKYRFLDETPHLPALVAAVGVRLPTGDPDRGLGEREVDVQPLAIASKTFGPVTLTVNAGYTFVTRDRDLDVVNVNASAEASVTKAWLIVGEVVSELATSRRADDSVVLRVGTVYAVSERVRLDAAAGFGATRASPDLLLTIGITININ